MDIIFLWNKLWTLFFTSKRSCGYFFEAVDIFPLPQVEDIFFKDVHTFFTPVICCGYFFTSVYNKLWIIFISISKLWIFFTAEDICFTSVISCEYFYLCHKLWRFLYILTLALLLKAVCIVWKRSWPAVSLKHEMNMYIQLLIPLTLISQSTRVAPLYQRIYLAWTPFLFFFYTSNLFMSNYWYLKVNFLVLWDQKIYFEKSVVWAEFRLWDIGSWLYLQIWDNWLVLVAKLCQWITE